jgi:hypothetical protein
VCHVLQRRTSLPAAAAFCLAVVASGPGIGNGVHQQVAPRLMMLQGCHLGLLGWRFVLRANAKARIGSAIIRYTRLLAAGATSKMRPLLSDMHASIDIVVLSDMGATTG